MPAMKTTRPITRAQRDVLYFVEVFIAKHGIAPTLDEISSQFGISRSTVHQHLQYLEQKGRIKRCRGEARAITVLKPWGELCPYCGHKLNEEHHAIKTSGT